MQITQPTFRTGASDDLATKDIYQKVVTSETVNKLKSLTTEYGKDAIAPITGKSRQAAKELVPAIFALSKEKGKMSSTQILSRLGMASPTLGRSFNGLNTGLQKMIMDGMQTSKLPKSVQVALNGRISSIDFKNVKSLDDLGKYMKDATGVTAMQSKDPRAIAGLMGTSMGIAMDMGVDGMTKDILETISGSEIKNGIAEMLGKKAIANSNTMDLYYLSQHSQPGVMIYSNPELISQYCKKYSRTKTLTYAQYVEEYNYLIQAFDRIDPSWDSYTRRGLYGTEVCTDITSLICDNVELNNLFSVVIKAVEDCPEKAYLAAPLHKKTTVEELLKAEFPSIAFNFSKTTSRVTSSFDL